MLPVSKLLKPKTWKFFYQDCVVLLGNFFLLENFLQFFLPFIVFAIKNFLLNLYHDIIAFWNSCHKRSLTITEMFFLGGTSLSDRTFWFLFIIIIIVIIIIITIIIAVVVIVIIAIIIIIIIILQSLCVIIFYRCSIIFFIIFSEILFWFGWNDVLKIPKACLENFIGLEKVS